MTSGRPGDGPGPWRVLDEQAYETHACRWLRAYPPRWRRTREEEVLGVLLDTRPSGCRNLTVAARSDLVRGAVTYRLRDRPPLVQRLTWRLFDTAPAERYEQWARDDLDGRSSWLRQAWLGQGGVFFVCIGTTGWVLEPPGVTAALVLLGAAVLITVLARLSFARPARRDKRHAELTAALVRAGAAPPDRPWRPVRRWSYGRWLLVPVLAAWVGFGLAAAAVAAVTTATSDPAAAVREVAVVALRSLGVFSVLPAVLVVSVLLAPVLLLPTWRRRIRTRPDQPYRARPVPAPWWVVLPLSVVLLLSPVTALSQPLSAVADGSWPASGPGLLTTSPGWLELLDDLGDLGLAAVFIGAPLVASSVVLPLVHLCVRGSLRERPAPAPALADVLGVAGWEQVPVDRPDLLVTPLAKAGTAAPGRQPGWTR